MKDLYNALFFLFTLLFAMPVQAEKLQVVTLYSPPAVIEKEGMVTGFATEIVQEALRRMDIEFHITVMPWKRALFMTRYGKADAIFYAVKNAEREEWFYYPDEPLVRETTILVKRSSDTISVTTDNLDYRKYRLGVGRGYHYGPQVDIFLRKSSFGSVEEATSINLNFKKLLEDRIDFFLADLNIIRYYMKTIPRKGVDLVTDTKGNPVILDSVDSYLAFSKETVKPDMVKRFSSVLKEMKTDGSYDKILRSYR